MSSRTIKILATVVIWCSSISAATQVVLLGTGTPAMDPDRSGPATAIVVNDTAYLIDFGPGVVRRAAAAAAAMPAMSERRRNAATNTAPSVTSTAAARNAASNGVLSQALHCLSSIRNPPWCDGFQAPQLEYSARAVVRHPAVRCPYRRDLWHYGRERRWRATRVELITAH